MNSSTLIIGVTGGAGSGKTTFVRLLHQLGADTLDVDDLARRLVEDSPDIRRALRRAFGDRFFNPDGSLRRRELGRMVFSDPSRLDKLNRIVWPPMLDLLKAEIHLWRSEHPSGILAADMAVLFEAGAEPLFDRTVLVTAPETVRAHRLRLQRKWDDHEIRGRMRSQLTDTEKSRRADAVVPNPGPAETLERHARSLMDAWKKSISN